uniref:Uncharacterized protein n=1 Tax=Takifugu rubripes TaxID=31033 RepID=A0A674N485_TAKRU
ISASETPKSRLETRSFPPVSTPAPPPLATPLNPLKPLSNMSCCHLSGSCLGSPCPCQLQSTRLGVGASRAHCHLVISASTKGSPDPRGPRVAVLSSAGSSVAPCCPNHQKVL